MNELQPQFLLLPAAQRARNGQVIHNTGLRYHVSSLLIDPERLNSDPEAKSPAARAARP